MMEQVHHHAPTTSKLVDHRETRYAYLYLLTRARNKTSLLIQPMGGKIHDTF